MKLQPIQAAKTLFGYNATVAKGRRQAPRSVTYLEDEVLQRKNRRTLVATSRDQYRNFSILAWMVRRHIDYISQFHLMVNTGIPEVDMRVKELFDWHARPENFDIAGRHGRNSAMRMFEAGKVLDGDCAFIKLGSGHLQAVEGDLIARPKFALPSEVEERVTEHGLVLDDFGKMLQAVVCKRTLRGQLEYSSLINAEDMIFDGYWTRFGQTRGISPLSTALNTMADLYEGWEWTLLKIKFHSFMGMALYRDEVDSDGLQTTSVAGVDIDENQAQTGEPQYDIQLKQGLMVLDLEDGDKVDMLESKTPNSPMIDYSGLMIRAALLSLDIPYTAFDSMRSSFSARIADRTEYEESSAAKRKKNEYALQNYSDWKVNMWAQNPTMLGDVLARNNMTTFDLNRKIEWVAHGTPWLDKHAEVQGDQLAISVGLDSAPMAARRRGKDAYKIVDEQAEFLKYAKEKGVPISQGLPGQPSVEQIKRDEEEGNMPDER